MSTATAIMQARNYNECDEVFAEKLKEGLPKTVNAHKMTPAELRQMLEDGYRETMEGQGQPLDEFILEFKRKHGIL